MSTPLLRTLLVSALTPLAALPLAAQNVTPPPLWYSGDTHELIQLCPGPGGVIPPDRSLDDVYAEMLAKDLNVMDVLVLVTGNTNCWQYLGQYAPRVTGMEESLTLGDPEHIIQYGCEGVGGPDPGCPYPAWGHTVGIGIDDAAYPLTADYPAPILDFFQAQPHALVGYPHVAWPVGTNVPASFPPLQRDLTRIYPLMAPFDVALGRVDFLSTPDVGHVATAITGDPWWGLWYKLLSAGRPVAITGGTVAQCYVALGPLDARTWVKIDSEPLDHDKWVAGILAGRTSIADGSGDFLSITADGKGAGEQVQLNGVVPRSIPVHVELHTSVPRQTTIEVVQDGQVVATEPVDLQSAGVQAFDTTISVGKSGWVAARTLPKAHTGAVTFLVNRRPVTDYATDDYFVQYSKYVLDYLDLAESLCAKCGGGCPSCIEVAAWLGTSEAQIRKEIADGRDIYQAMRDYTQHLPGDSKRFGVSTPSCAGPIGIGLKTAPSPGQDVTFTAFNGPPNTTAFLLVGRNVQLPPIEFNGTLRYLPTTPKPQMFMTTTNGGGYAEAAVHVPLSSQVIDAYVQWFFVNTTQCPGTGQMSSSDAAFVEIPRSLYKGR